MFSLLLLVFTEVHETLGVGLLGQSVILFLHESGCVLHLKNGILAEVHEGLQLLFVSLSYNGVEEPSLRFLNLWFFPLIDVFLLDLEVDSFDALGAAHDLDATEERFEVVED